MISNKKKLISARFISIPFSPSKCPFFYGWVIVFAGIIGILMSFPGSSLGVSVFTDHLIYAVDINRVNLSMAYMAGTILSGLCVPYAGKIYDRYGVRFVAIIAGFFMGMALIYLSRIADIASWTLNQFNFLDASITMFALFTVGFFSLRFFGQGILTMASRNMVMKWFEKRRGFANAILGISITFGFSYSPQVMDMLINALTWESAWFFLGIVSALGFVMFVFIFYRDNPTKYGLIPDGKYIKSKKKIKKPNLNSNILQLKEYTLKEAKATYSFWIFNLTVALQALFFSALSFHIISIFAVNGYDHQAAITIFLPAAFVSLFFHFFGSWLSDYIRLKFFLLIQLFGMLLSMFALLFLEHSTNFRLLLIAGNGIMQGMYGILSALTWPRFFGLKHLGAISGYAMGWMVVGSAIGPFMFGFSFHFTGKYDLAVILCIVTALVLFILGFKAENVNRVK